MRYGLRDIRQGADRPRRRPIWPIVVLSVLFLALCSGLALADTVGSQTGPSEAAPGGAATSPAENREAGPTGAGAVEVESARTATSDTFRLPDGEREVRVYEAPVNEKVGPGEWEPIEEGLEPGPGTSLTSEAGPVEISLPEKLGAGAARLSTGKAWVAARLLGTTSEPAEVEGATASYELDGSDAGVELSGLTNGIKEDIEIPGPSSPNSYRFELTASAGLAPSVAGDGSVQFKEGTKVVAELPAPTLSDSSAGFGGMSDAARYHLEQGGPGGWVLTVEASKEWLEAPDRVFPVTLDPSILTLEPYFDCTLYSAPPIEGWSRCAGNGFAHLAAEAYDRTSTPDEYSRSILFFRLIGLVPATAEVQSAKIGLYSSTTAGSTEGLQLQRVEQAWDNYASWRYSGYPNCGYECAPWAVPGGTAVPAGSIQGEMTTASRGGSGPGWWTIPVERNLAQEWVSGGEPKNLGVDVEQLHEKEHVCTPTCVYRHVEFESSADPVAAQRPYLSLTYIPRAPITNKLSSPAEGTHTARRLKLAAKWETAGVEGVTFQYRVAPPSNPGETPRPGPFQTVPPELVRTAEGKPVSWPIPTGGSGERKTEPVFFDAAHATPEVRSEGGAVEVRALFTGSAESAEASAPVKTFVNRATGGPKDATASVGPGTVDLLTGNFTTSATDVSMPTFNSALEFTRSYSSRSAEPGVTLSTRYANWLAEKKSLLGAGWNAGFSLEEAGGSGWKNLKIEESKGSEEEEEEEGEEEFERSEWNYSWALLTTLEGQELSFEKNAAGLFTPPPEVTGWTLVAEEAALVLTDPNGTRTTFSNSGGGNEYVPTSVSMSGGSSTKTTRIEYELPEAGKKRIHMVIAPYATGALCTTREQAMADTGCRALVFNYAAATKWGAPAEDGQRLESISYYAPGLFAGPVAQYEYDNRGRLVAEWDPRLPTPLKTTYSYGVNGGLRTIKPPGQEPWTLEYGTFDEEASEGEFGHAGRLTAVSRPSLLASPTTAQTTIAYEVPVSGAGAPYEMGGTSVRQWGQKDVPADATAVFPPDQVPTSSPPTSYSHATVHYMDSEGFEVNTATPSPIGGGASISTGEEDEFGNTVSELSPRNRNAVLAEPEAKRAERAEQLDTRRFFGEKGTQLEEEEGPLHPVELETGSVTPARFKRTIKYDQGMPAGTKPDPHLPTRETRGALVGGVIQDAKVVETRYDWSLRRPEKEITVMGSEKPVIERVTRYNDTTGLPIEESQPSNPGGGGAGSTKLIYDGSGSGAGCETPAYWGLLCKSEPAGQPAAGEELQSGEPKLLVKKILAYNAMGEPTEVAESPGGEEGSTARKTIAAYDQIGRLVSMKIEGGGAVIPKSETIYDPSTGLVTKQQFVCSPECPAKATTSTYNAIGQATEYEDADGNKTKVTYDIDGRPKTVSDAKGTQTYGYAEASGVLTKLEDSGAGTFTAGYDADGDIIERGLPNGLTAKTTFNQVDEPTKLAYVKGTSTWLEETLQRSIFGQVRSDAGTLVNDSYTYDAAGRLEEAQETPSSGNCVTRKYSYDADSNRLSKTTREPELVACAKSGGAVQGYKYDAGDRLQATGLTYDPWGRITNLPAEFAGGKALATTYFSDDMVATQSQNGVVNTYELDASLRQRQRVQAGGVAGTEVFHYDGPGDSPSWTAIGTTWSRDITGIGGELAAVQESSGAVTFKLTNLHGDVIASASSSPTATKPLATYRFSEFGEPMEVGAGRFGWLGGKGRKTELSSGVIQMGARSYVPALGRFLSVDPVRGGSANSYD